MSEAKPVPAPWLATAFFAYVVGCSLLAPWLEYLRIPESSYAYAALGWLCHQLPSRCLFLKTSPMGLCARCFGIYAAVFAVFALACLGRRLRLPLAACLLLAVPCLLDGGSQYLGFRLSNNPLRLVTGLLAGAGLGILFETFLSTLKMKVSAMIQNHRHTALARSLFTLGMALALGILLAAGARAGDQDPADCVVLRDGTPVILSTIEELRSDTQTVGQVVRLSVVNNVIVDGVVVIAAGSTGTGVVSIRKDSDYMGQSGRIGLVVESVAATDGQNVRVRGTLQHSGQDREVAVAVVSYACCPAVAAAKGDKGVIPPGSEIKAYVSGTYKIKRS